MSLQLIKVLLNKEFYDKYKHKLSVDFFIADNNVKGIFLSLQKAYQSISTDLTLDSLRNLHYSYNPALSAANKNIVDKLFVELEKLDITKQAGEEILKKAIEQQLWTKIMNAGMNAADGLKVDFLDTQAIFDNIREGINLHGDIRIVSNDLDELLDENKDQQQWKFHIPSLRKVLDGVGNGTFTIVAASVNAGKTGLLSSLIAQPGGFLDQGAKVLYIGTEEKASRTKLRMWSSYTGYPVQKFYDKKIKEEAKEAFKRFDKTLVIFDQPSFALESLDAYLSSEKKMPDIVCIDTLDDLSINGDNSSDVTKHELMYKSCRELSKKHDIALIATSQANHEAENRAVFGTECLYGSRVAKGGALDVCLCIGRKLEENQKDEGLRTINVAKNKLTGNHSCVTVTFDFATSRIRA